MSLAKATLASLVVATVVLFTLVLPAEYGLDPLGTGRLLGLTDLSKAEVSALTEENGDFRTDRITFELAPFESVEYKYRLERDSALVFGWTASGEVVFDLHAEPDGAEAGYAESFERGRGAAQYGTYVASFPGIHGWFWENRTLQPVTVELSVSGFFDHAIEFRDGDQSLRAAADEGERRR